MRQIEWAVVRWPLHAAALVFLVLAAGPTAPCAAHQTLFERPDASELAKTQPPLTGSEEFARILLQRLRGQFGPDQFELLDELEKNLNQADRIRWGFDYGVSQDVAEYFRWRAETKLLKLLESYDGAIEIDLRPGVEASAPEIPVRLLPGDRAVVLKVVSGDDGLSFAALRWNLSAEQVPEPFHISTDVNGTRFVLIVFEQVPTEAGVMPVELRPGELDAPRHMRALRFETPPLGHVRIEIADQQGQSTPAVVQLAAQDNGQLCEIAGAVDLREQLNDVVPHLGELGRGYTFFLPGKKRGRYWVVDEPLELSLPVGTWDLTVLHGPEHIPYQQAIDVVADKWTRHTCRLQRWIDMPKQGWYSGDDHVHARLMNGADAKKLLAYSRAVDIHVANILEMGDPMRTYYAQRGFGVDFRVGDRSYWLVPGQEDPRSELGHAIGLNLKSKVRRLDRYLQNDWIAARIHEQGGLYGHTHVGANACFAHREMALYTPLGIVDFNSIMQASLGTELYYNFLNLGFEMNASAGADTPYGGTIGATRVFVFTGQNDFSPDAWFEGLKAGRSFVTNGPMLEFAVDGQLPGSVIDVDEPRTLRVKAAARGLANWSAPKKLQLVRFGEVIAEAVSTDAQHGELSLEYELNAEDSFWIAARVDGYDGSAGHTTPVYVKRAGLRHWDSTIANELISKQLGIMEEIEDALRQSEHRVTRDQNPLDYWNLRNVEQADAVRRQVRTARAFYENLRETYQREQAIRDN